MRFLISNAKETILYSARACRTVSFTVSVRAIERRILSQRSPACWWNLLPAGAAQTCHAGAEKGRAAAASRENLDHSITSAAR
jgi:uncharacterized protein YbbK (DUF523 family)